MKLNSHNKIVALMIIATLSTGANLYFLNKKEENYKEEKKIKEIFKVEVFEPKTKEIIEELNVTGDVSPWQESSIGSEVSGMRVDEILVDVGQVVSKNQILAVLNSETMKAEYDIAKSGVLEAEANLKQARENADRARSLDKTNALSLQQMNQYLTSEKTAHAKLESAKANLELKKVKLDQTKIKAPDSGIVSERRVSVGNLVGSADLFKIIRQEKLQWKPQIDVTDMDLIYKGQQVSIVSKSGDVILAKVSEVSPRVNPETRKATVLVDLPKELHKNKIHVGMFLNGAIKIGKRQSLFVPEQSVKSKGDEDYLYVLKEDSTVREVKVDLGKKVEELVEVKYGIESKDKIIVGDIEKLNDEDKVIVRAEKKKEKK